MLVIKCAGCKAKLFKYDKIGHGAVLRCYKDKITKNYELKYKETEAVCKCGNIIGSNLGLCIKMNQSAFTYSGTKRNS